MDKCKNYHLVAMTYRFQTPSVYYFNEGFLLRADAALFNDRVMHSTHYDPHMGGIVRQSLAI